MYDTYTMPDQLLPDAQVENKEMLGYVHRRVQKLPDIYKTIIIHSYGLYGSVIIPDQELADFL